MRGDADRSPKHRSSVCVFLMSPVYAGGVATLRVPDEARKPVESSALGHPVTLNPDGSPQVSCIWVGLNDGMRTR